MCVKTSFLIALSLLVSKIITGSSTGNLFLLPISEEKDDSALTTKARNDASAVLSTRTAEWGRLSEAPTNETAFFFYCRR